MLMKNNDKKALLIKLRKFRLDNDLTFPELARMLKMSIAQTNVLCKDSDLIPHERTLHKIEKFLKKFKAI